MSMDGGPAFPIVDTDSKGNVYTSRDGMTLRDYFAAKAMQGFAADPDMGDREADEIAALAYVWADAMLKERQKGGA